MVKHYRLQICNVWFCRPETSTNCTMKPLKVILLTWGLGILLLSPSLAGELDSLLNARQELQTRYTELIGSPRTSPATERQIFDLQNSIINLDNMLLEEYLQGALSEREEAVAQLQKSRQELQEQKKQNLTEQQSNENFIRLGKIIIGGLILLMIIALIIITHLAVKVKKSGSAGEKQKVAQNLLESYKAKNRELHAEIDKLKKSAPAPAALKNEPPGKLEEKVAEMEKRAGEMHIQIIQLKSDKQKLEEELTKQQKATPQTMAPEKITEKPQPPAGGREEVLILEHQLSDARAMLEDLTEKNQLIGEELQKNIELEQRLKIDNEKLKQQLQQQESTQKESANTSSQFISPSAEIVEQKQKEISKLQQKIEIYREQLKAEEQARETFEKQINNILAEYKAFIDRL